MSEEELNEQPDIDPSPSKDISPEQPPGRSPKQDWLHTVARATETVAPLVARQAPKVEEIPEDRRGRLATVLAIVGILMAVFQFMVQFYDLVTRPLAPLLGALPYIVAGLLVAGVGFGVYAAVRAKSPRHRLFALGSTLLVLMVALTWGGWLAYDALRPPAGYRILVSEFDGSKARDYIDFGQRIAENLRSQLANVGQPIEVRRTTAVYADPDTARREGERQKAGIVIWGWYDDRGVSPHVEVLSLPQGSAAQSNINIPVIFATANAAGPRGSGPMALQPVLSKLAPVTSTPLALPSLDLFTANGPDQMAYVASTVLAMSVLAGDDLPHALALFDQALASVAGDPQTAQGQEVVHYQRAGVLYRLGRYQEARADLEQALKLKPDYAPAQLLLAAILADRCTPARDQAAALAAALQAAALQPTDVMSQQYLAQLALRSGDTATALRAAEAARDLDPNQSATFTLLAAVYDTLGRSEDGRSAREAALTLAQAAAQGTAGEQSPVPVDALYTLGDAYLALDRYDEALAAYQKAAAVAPQDLRQHLAKGNVYYWQGDTEQAAAEYLAWAKAAPADPAPHMLLGLVYAGEKKADDELAQYAQAAELSDCDPSVLLLLGGAQAVAGDYKAAERTYAEALAVDPQNPDVLFSAGTNHLLLEDNQAAADNLTAFVALRPDMKGQYYLGVAYNALGEKEKAQAAFAEAARLGEQISPAPLDLAFAYVELGRTDDAIAIYLQQLAAQETPEVHAYLGALYAEKGATDLARQEYQRALELDPDQSLAHFSLANLAYAAGDWQTAAAEYEAYLKAGESASIHDYAAQAYQQLGDLPAVLRHLQAASRLAPNDADLALRAANVANWLNRLDEAEAAAEQALRLRPADPAVYLTRGQLAYKRCDIAAAVADLERSAAISPTVAIYTGSLGGYYAAQGQNDKVKPLVDQLQAAPQSDYVAHWLAGSLLTLDDRAAAIAELQAALKEPGVPPLIAAAIHIAIGHQQVLNSDLDAARAEFEGALRLAPDYIDAEIWLGDLAWVVGDTAAAQVHYHKSDEGLAVYAAKYSNDSAAAFAPAIQARLALAARKLGDTTGEQAALAKAGEGLAALRQAAPDWPMFAVVEGTVELVRGDREAAAAAFDRAVACDRTIAGTREMIENLVAAK